MPKSLSRAKADSQQQGKRVLIILLLIKRSDRKRSCKSARKYLPGLYHCAKPQNIWLFKSSECMCQGNSTFICPEGWSKNITNNMIQLHTLFHSIILGHGQLHIRQTRRQAGSTYIHSLTQYVNKTSFTAYSIMCNECCIYLDLVFRFFAGRFT